MHRMRFGTIVVAMAASLLAAQRLARGDGISLPAAVDAGRALLSQRTLLPGGSSDDPADRYVRPLNRPERRPAIAPSARKGREYDEPGTSSDFSETAAARRAEAGPPWREPWVIVVALAAMAASALGCVLVVRWHYRRRSAGPLTSAMLGMAQRPGTDRGPASEGTPATRRAA